MLFKKAQLPGKLVLNDREDSDFDNSEFENVGIDLALTEEGDLSVTNRGDLNILDPDKSIAVSLLRRVLTPPGGYSRVFIESDTLSDYGSELENIAYSYLSSNKTNVLVQELRKQLEALAEVDERLDVIDVELKPTGLNSINLNLTYRTKGSQVIKSLIYQYK